MNDILNKVFEGIDQNLISEDTKKKVTEMINSVVEARVTAKAADVLEKNKKLVQLAKDAQLSEANTKKEFAEKEAILKEEAKNFVGKIAEEFTQKEAILIESLNEYKQETEKTVKEVAVEYRHRLEKVVMDESAAYREFIEQIALEEASEFKKMQESALANDVSTFKETMLNRVDEYLGTQITEKIVPANLMEAAAEAAAYKPLVEEMVGLLSKNYIKLDSTGYETVKAAKSENVKISEAYNNKVKETVKLETRVKELEKKVKLNSLTEGMTQAQKQKASRLLENYSVEQLDDKFTAIKDIIIKESVKPERVSLKQETNAAAKAENVTRQVNKLVESVTKPVGKVGFDSEISEWATNLTKMRRN